MKTNHQNGEKFRKRINRTRHYTRKLLLKRRRESFKAFKKAKNQHLRNKIKSSIRNGDFDFTPVLRKTWDWEA